MSATVEEWGLSVLRDLYVRGEISIEEFEARLPAILTGRLVEPRGHAPREWLDADFDNAVRDFVRSEFS
jgi:hypothetical protein